MMNHLLDVQGIKKYFSVTDFFGREIYSIKAVDDVSFYMDQGEIYGLVGESGCGKSTLGRCILNLIPATDGKVILQGKDFFSLKEGDIKKLRQDIQMIFQDPYLALNPKKRVGNILMEVLIIKGVADEKERYFTALDILEKVGLRPEHFYRFPHEFSGGQRQRIGIARALLMEPKLIICDEPVSALDVSIQAQILNLLLDAKRKMNMSYLFVTHNMSIVRHVSDRIGVMYLGHLIEEAATDDLFRTPQHPYTQALLSAAAVPNPHIKKDRIPLTGELPSPMNIPAGCVFSGRCPYVRDDCKKYRPTLLAKEQTLSHRVACFYA